MLRKNVLNAWQFPEYFRIFGGRLKLQGITKKFHLYISGKNILATAGNLKANEQSKHKSASSIFFPS